MMPNGIIVPVITPFDQKQNIDENALRSVIRHILNGGVHGIFVT